MAQEILVIILSGTLALFLILGIIAMVLIIKILRHLKTISAKAEHIAGNAESVTDFFSKTAGPAAVVKLFVSVADTVLNRGKKKSD